MITNTPPRVHPEGRYSVTETAVHLGVSRTTVFRWIKAGYLTPRLHKATGRRFLQGADIALFWKLHY